MNLERSNVVPFGKTPKRPAGSPELITPQRGAPPETPAPEEPGKDPRGGFLQGCGSALRYMLFLVLLWLRVPLRWIFGLAGSLSTLGLIVVLTYWGLAIEAHPVLPRAAVALGVTSFVSISFMWLYDSLLMRLSPEPIFFTQ